MIGDRGSNDSISSSQGTNTVNKCIFLLLHLYLLLYLLLGKHIHFPPTLPFYFSPFINKSSIIMANNCKTLLREGESWQI